MITLHAHQTETAMCMMYDMNGPTHFKHEYLVIPIIIDKHGFRQNLSLACNFASILTPLLFIYDQ